MKENDYRFGNFVCQLREEKGMTQAELAQMLDVTPAAVSKWENGESKPRTEKLFELAKLLGVSAEELMNGERKPEEPQSVLATRPGALPSNDIRFRRIGAFFLDVFFCEFAGLLTMPLFLVVFKDKINLFSNILLSVNLIALILMLFRDLIFNGRSPGKRITRLDVVNAADGSRPKWYKLLLRNLPFLIYLIDFFVLIKNGCSLGDMMTDTFTPPYVKRTDTSPVKSYTEGALAQSYVTIPKKKRKIIIIVACVILGIALLLTCIFTLGFNSAKQTPGYSLAIEYLIESDGLSQYDLQESDFTLHSYRSSGHYKTYGFWVKGQDIYVTVRTENGKSEVYQVTNASSQQLK